MSTGVSSLGPIASPQINNSIWVGSVLYSTIQSAVTAAAQVGGTVIIPWGCTPADTIAGASGSAGVNIRDLRTAIECDYTWSGSAYTLAIPSTFNVSVGYLVNGLPFSSLSSFTFVQGIAASTWVIVHGLDTYPTVTVTDSSGNWVIGSAHYDSLNQVTLNFASAFSGTAVLS